MPELRSKVIAYKRAEFFGAVPGGVDLEQLIKRAAQKLRTVEDRSILRAGGYMMRMLVCRLDDRSAGCFLHLTFETPGEHASVIPKAAGQVEEVSVRTIPPPNDAEFMDGDAFVYVRGDHLCVCTSGVTTGTVRHFIHALFQKAALPRESWQFELFNAVDSHKMSSIQSKGVKSIELAASMYEATARYHARKLHAAGLLGSLTKRFRSIFSSSEYDSSDDSLRVSVCINVDKRRRGGLRMGYERLERMATDILRNEQSEDDYVIVLEGGDKILPGQMILKKSVEISGSGKSVDRDDTWRELSIFFTELQKSGALEE